MHGDNRLLDTFGLSMPDDQRITLEEWNNASTAQRAKWLRDHVLIRREDLAVLHRLAYPNLYPAEEKS